MKQLSAEQGEEHALPAGPPDTPGGILGQGRALRAMREACLLLLKCEDLAPTGYENNVAQASPYQVSVRRSHEEHVPGGAA